MQNKKWEYKNKNLNKEDVISFAKRHSLPPVIACIILNRGITSDKDVAAFLKKGLAFYKAVCYYMQARQLTRVCAGSSVG